MEFFNLIDFKIRSFFFTTNINDISKFKKGFDLNVYVYAYPQHSLYFVIVQISWIVTEISCNCAYTF